MESQNPGTGVTSLLAEEFDSYSNLVAVLPSDGPLQRTPHSMAAAFPRVSVRSKGCSKREGLSRTGPIAQSYQHFHLVLESTQISFGTMQEIMLKKKIPREEI